MNPLLTATDNYPQLSDRIQSTFIDLVLIIVLMFISLVEVVNDQKRPKEFPKKNALSPHPPIQVPPPEYLPGNHQNIPRQLLPRTAQYPKVHRETIVDLHEVEVQNTFFPLRLPAFQRRIQGIHRRPVFPQLELPEAHKTLRRSHIQYDQKIGFHTPIR